MNESVLNKILFTVSSIKILLNSQRNKIPISELLIKIDTNTIIFTHYYIISLD
jgi:hypothetical protein